MAGCRRSILAAVLLLVLACPASLPVGGVDATPIPRELPPLQNITAAAGLEDLPAMGDPRNPPDPLTFPSWEAFVAAIDLWGGTAIGDYDRDGLPDIAVSRRGTTALYHNDGNLTFTDVGAAAGLGSDGIGMGVTFVDVDNDGWLDLHLVHFGTADSLYHNEGDGTFVDVAALWGIDSTRHGTGAAWADYDADGCLDLYVPAYLHETNQLFRARCDGSDTFEDVTMQTDTGDAGWSFQALWSDYDGDDDPDLLVINDFGPDVLYRNNDNGTFSDISAVSHLDQGVAGGMGAAIGDYDNDADLDLFVTNYYENGLYTNLGDGTFHESMAGSPLNNPLVGWGANFYDADNDGDLDLFLANGFIFEYTHPKDQPNRLFENVDGQFVDATEQVGLDDSGVTHGSAVGDLDGDGTLELYTVDLDGPSSLYRRSPTTHHWLQLQLQGALSNRQGIGATVRAMVGPRTLATELRAGGSYLSMDEPILHLGLGDSARADRLEIRWPSGATTVLTNVSADQRVLVVEEPGVIAAAGPDRTVGTSVQIDLDGTASTSTADGPQLPSTGNFRWTVGPPGPTAQVLVGAQVQLTLHEAGRVPVQLQVTDSTGATDTDWLTLEVADRQPPTVTLGPEQTLAAGTPLDLDGSATTDDDPALRTLGTFQWQVTDPSGTQTDSEGFALHLVPILPGTYVITLTVRDPSGNVGSGQLLVHVTDGESPQVALVRAWEVDEDLPLLLAASAFDNDPAFDPLAALHWSVPNAQPPTDGDGPTLQVVFPTPGQFPVRLTATDAAGNVAIAEATVQVHDRTAPRLSVGHGWSIPEDSPVPLTLALLEDNDPLFASTGTVHWQVRTLSGVLDRYGREVMVRIDSPGAVVVSVTATDRSGNSATVSAQLQVVDHTAPSARAGTDQRLRPGQVAVISARQSSDNDPQLLRSGSAHWSILGPHGNVSLDGWDVLLPLPSAGTYVVTLTVRDAAGNVGTDHQRLVVSAPPDDSLQRLWRQVVLVAVVLLPLVVLVAVAIRARPGG